jgi:dihydropteroate synthase
MGILNVTPDSFSDGGQFVDLETAIAHAHKMIEDGADIIDVGGESTRPSSGHLSVKNERKRVIPVIKRLLDETSVPISIDTYKPEIAREALDMGVHMLNDVNALREPGITGICAEFDVPVVLMHFYGGPHKMVKEPKYDDLMGDIIAFLDERIKFAEDAGIDPDKIITDPGVGFSKYGADNIEILRRLDELRTLDKPVLLGASRKSFIGDLVDKPPQERLYGSLASVAVGIMKMVDFVRVHDVAETHDVIKITDAVFR